MFKQASRILFAALAVTMLGGVARPTAAQDNRVLKVWHYESENGAMGSAWAAAMKTFEETHPGVKVEYEQKGYEQIRQTAQMILSSDAAPDVMESPKGNATAGFLSKQGLLTDMSDEVAKRGWDKILTPSLATVSRYDENGVMGSGKWYGVTNYGEYVMVYYNKDMFKKYNIAVPTTVEELEAAMDVFVKDGITPIALSAAEYPAQQIFYELALSKADRSLINALQLYQGEMDFHSEAFTYGAEKTAEWVAKGYISKDSTGMKAEDMGVAWEGGKYPIMISGSWWYGRLMTEIKDFEWDSFLFPGKMHQGSGGNIWVVPTGSQNKDLAYDFIDITLQQDNQTLLANAGGIPVNADNSKITDPKIKALNDNFAKIVSEDGLAFYLDWPVPGYYDVLVQNTQELISGSKSPSEFLDAIGSAYTEGKPTP